ncbi:MAG: hypothetical protein ACI87W_001463 [Halieaceae bacterium]|jgi:hypothetical protein
MANINKMSVRGELDRLQSEFGRLSEENALTGESRLLMRSMLTLLELICAISLEKNTPKTTKYSSKPSSQTDKDESSLALHGSKGKGKQERRDLAANSRVVETVTVSEVTVCPVCGKDLSHTHCHGQEYRTRIDIVFEKVTEPLLKSPAINVDETSLRVDRKNHWIHVYSAGDIILNYLHRRRGKEAMKSVNIIPRYGGVIIHDYCSSHLSYTHCAHGLCGSHLLRELTFNDYRWAGNMKRVLQETCKTRLCQEV